MREVGCHNGYTVPEGLVFTSMCGFSLTFGCDFIFHVIKTQITWSGLHSRSTLVFLRKMLYGISTLG